MVWLRQLIKGKHAKHRGKRCAQHRCFKRNRNECRPAVVWLTTDVQRVINYFHPVLHEEPAQSAKYPANQNNQWKTGSRKTNRLGQLLNWIGRISVDAAITGFIRPARSRHEIGWIIKLRHDSVERWRRASPVHAVLINLVRFDPFFYVISHRM